MKPHKTLTILACAIAMTSAFADDCNLNGQADSSDIQRGTSRDCNRNGIPDECDLLTGARPGSIAVFRCDEVKGLTLLDVSGGLRHGKLRDVTFATKNPFGMTGNGSISFFKRNAAVDLSAGAGTGFDSLRAISLSAYLLPESIEGLRYVLWGDDAVFSLRIHNGVLELLINARVVATAPLSETGRWTHVCGVYDGNEARIYKNGKLAARASARLGNVLPIGIRKVVRIGNDETADMTGFDRAFLGYMDQVRIAGRALSDAEIIEDYLEPYTPGESADCNANGLPDECDLSGKRSMDENQNRVPDECEDLDPPVLSGLDALRDASLLPARVRLDRGTAAFVRVKVPVSKSANSLEQAYEYLLRFRELYGLKDPRTDLVLSRVTEQHGAHFFFAQVHQGLRVLHSEIGVHILNGEVLAATGRYIPGLPFFPRATVRTSSAEVTLLEAVPASGIERTAEPRLVIHNAGLTTGAEAPSRLAWRYFVKGVSHATRKPSHWEVLIDAHQGSLLSLRETIHADTPDKDFSIYTAHNTNPPDCDDLEGDEWFDEDGSTDDDGDGIGEACDDDDRDARFNNRDNCPTAWNPDQTDIDGDGDGLECDLGDQYLLYGTSQVQWLKNIATRVDRFVEPIKIPIGPCRQDCPDWLPEEFQTDIRLELSHNVRVDIVDERGFVVSKAGEGFEKTMRFRPRPDSQLDVPGGEGFGGGGSAESLAPEGEEDMAFPGRRYFLRITPGEGMKEGDTIRFSVAVTSGRADPEPVGEPVRPGDCNRDGKIDLSDAVCMLGYLFQGTTRSLHCGDGTSSDPSNLRLLDFNGDSKLDISDAVANLSFLFNAGLPHALGPNCVRFEGCGPTCLE